VRYQTFGECMHALIFH